jgi:hypothetical protein
VLELIPLAIASAFWPILLAVVVISLRAPHPGRLMLAFLAGGLLTTVTVGLVVIYALQGASLTSGSDSWFGPGLEITVGAAALAAAYILWKRYQRDGVKPKPERSEPGRTERMLDRGAPLAFVGGIVLNIVPGVVPVVALKNIAEGNYSFAETFGLVLGFYVIMFAFIELPLIGFAVAPEPTKRATASFNAWLDRNGHRLGIGALAVIGVYMIVRGILLAI